MTMNNLWQGILIAGVVNLLLAVAWLIGRTAHRQKEDRYNLHNLRHVKGLNELSKTSSEEDYLETLEKLEKRWLEERLERPEKSPTLLILNHPDFGAMLISALLAEAGVILLYYGNGLLYYFGILFIFAGASSFVWIFSGMASSLVGQNEMLREIVASSTVSARSSALADKALETSKAAIALSHDAMGIAATDANRPVAVGPEPMSGATSQ